MLCRETKRTGPPKRGLLFYIYFYGRNEIPRRLEDSSSSSARLLSSVEWSSVSIDISVASEPSSSSDNRNENELLDDKRNDSDGRRRFWRLSFLEMNEFLFLFFSENLSNFLLLLGRNQKRGFPKLFGLIFVAGRDEAKRVFGREFGRETAAAADGCSTKLEMQLNCPLCLRSIVSLFVAAAARQRDFGVNIVPNGQFELRLLFLFFMAKNNFVRSLGKMWLVG